ncbi:MAG: hypothetical protein Q8N03_04865 [Ignavibacteria bacterium]|nr:hypothetical protein [Ignavibacteria bacterium]
MRTKYMFGLTLTVLLLVGLTTIGRAQETKSFDVRKGENLSLKVNGDVKVESWSKDEVYIEVSGVRKANLEELKINQEGNTVFIEFKSNDDASFLIKTPEQFNLDIKTSGGDISCLGKYFGNINSATAGGDIKVEKVSGNVVLTTAGGDITTGDIEGNLKAATSGGDIKTGSISGEGKISTSGGDITVVSSNKSLSLATSGGDIKVGNINGDFSASTSGGDIFVGNVNGEAKLNTSGGDIKLAGAKGNTKANSSGGDLKLENLYGSVKANTSGGKVYVELNPDGSEESKIASSGGSITLLIPENAKATIEAVIKVQSKNDLKDGYTIVSDYKIDNYITDEDRKEIRATIVLNGGGKLISLNTSNSQITVKKWNK